MATSQPNPKVNFFFEKPGQWHEAYLKLREIFLSCELQEELKWGVPCYTCQGSNVALIHGFKEYCAILFHKGVLLKDSEHLLIQQTKNVQAGRQLRFRSPDEIAEKETIIRSYLFEAMENERKGLKVNLKKTRDFEMPEELKDRMTEDPGFRSAFESLSPGRQRGYILFFSGAKQSKTRVARIEKYTDQIFSGKGLKDE